MSTASSPLRIGVCGYCAGLGWRNHGWAVPEPVDGICRNVMIVDWRKCEPCAGQGIYVPASLVGLPHPPRQNAERT